MGLMIMVSIPGRGNTDVKLSICLHVLPKLILSGAAPPHTSLVIVLLIGYGLFNILPLALQPAVGFGLLNNILPFFLSPFLSINLKSTQLFPFFDFRNNKFFYCVWLLAPRQTPNLEDQGIPFCLGHHP
jgi:hypothetical protein